MEPEKRNIEQNEGMSAPVPPSVKETVKPWIVAAVSFIAGMILGAWLF